MKRSLRGDTPNMVYWGIIQEHQKDVISIIETDVFQKWDGLSTSPPKRRPQQERVTVITGMSLLSVDSAGQPGWPRHIMEKFDVQSEQYAALSKLKTPFEAEFPPQQQQSNLAARGQPRVSGVCDFSIEGGAEPLDCERVVDLVKVGQPEADVRTIQKQSVFRNRKNINIWIHFEYYCAHKLKFV